MKIIEDPDHWYELDSLTDTTVSSHDNVTAEFPANFDKSRLRNLRDQSDRGELECELVVRNLESFELNWPALAARAHIEQAPRTVDKHPELAEAIKTADRDPTFSDVEEVKQKASGLDEMTVERRAEAIELCTASGQTDEYLPSPALVNQQEEFVRHCLEIAEAQDIENAIGGRLLEMDGVVTAFRSPVSDNRCFSEWFAVFDWSDDQSLTLAGKQAKRYVDSRSAEQIKWQAAALLERAKSEVSFSVENKLSKASLNILPNDSIEELDDQLLAVLATKASSEAYIIAQDAAAEQGLLDGVDSLSLSEDRIQTAIRESKPDILEDDILMQIKRIPVRLYEEMPDNDLQVVVSALEPSSVINALDQAINNKRSEIERTIEALRDINDIIEPLAPSQANDLLSALDETETLLDALSVDAPRNPTDCIELYNKVYKQKAALMTEFTRTWDRINEEILAECEDYIRDNYRQWANSNPSNRPLQMITDIPALTAGLLTEHDHILLIVSDGFGLRQWLQASHENEILNQWRSAGIVSNTPMSTVFPSETGTGHFSLFTGQFPMEHGRDDIESSVRPNDENLFARARQQGAYTQALSYLSPDDGFCEVLNEAADEFHQLEGLQSEAAGLSESAIDQVATVVNSYERSVSLLQHNQIDQLHEGGDHIADTLVSGVAGDVVEFINKLTARLEDEILPILTADHGMIRTGDTRKGLHPGGDAYQVLQNMNESTEEWGQRVFALQSKSQEYGVPQSSSTSMLEVLSEREMRQFRAQTEEKFDGRTGRFCRRYYSAEGDMTATHGGFTFDEMFIPFVQFDTEKIAEKLS